LLAALAQQACEAADQAAGSAAVVSTPAVSPVMAHTESVATPDQQLFDE